MSVSPTKSLWAALFLTLLSLTGALAQTSAPLALPPSTDASQPIVITAPEPVGLALPPAAPVASAVPVEAANLTDVKPDSVGLLVSNEGGLGAGLWKDTPRVVVQRFMPMLSLPVPYAALNDLAARLLLTTAASPEGAAGEGGQSLTALRVEKLVALGHVTEAWKLVNVATADPVDDITLRQVVEAALVSPVAAEVCAKLPEIIQRHTGAEWQKSLAVCQLQAKDAKAAQLSLDVLHTQDVHDEAFFALAEKNIIGGGKQLPRQLTPLKPLTLALLQLTDMPVRGEVYAHPDVPLIQGLLNIKTADENARLGLAERAAAKGLISAADLAAVYRGQTFPPDTISNANISGENGGRLRALLYQASQQERSPQNRVGEAVKFLQSLDAMTMGGNVLPVLGSVLGEVQPAAEFNASAASVAKIYVLAGKPALARAWLEQARNAARGMPDVATELHDLWPLAALAGLESEKDFPAALEAWLKGAIRASDQDPDFRAQKTKAASILLLLDAAGFTVGDEVWAKLADAAGSEKLLMPSPLVMQRLRTASESNHKGETVLMGLLAATGGKEDPPVLANLDVIRALHAVGLTSDATALARDVVVRVLGAK